MHEIGYTVLYHHTRRPATGVQIGRFAVRMSAGEVLYDADGRNSVARPWSVDHIASGISVLDLHTFEDAVFVADDVSRFSAKDPDATTLDALIEQLGDRVVGWLTWIEQQKGGYPHLSFRQWCAWWYEKSARVTG